MKILNKIRGLFARGVVQSVDESPKMRTVQGEFLLGDVREGLEHFEPYGFTSRVHPGAEIFAGFLNGDRSHGVVIVTADRRYRLHVEEGEVAIFDDQGQKVHLTREGIEVVTPKNLTATIDGNVTATVGGSISASVSGDVTASVQGALSAEVGGGVTLKCPTLRVDCPSTTFTGAVTIQGHITGTGGMAVSGGSGASVTGSMTVSDDVTAGGISLQNHTHTAQGETAETTGPH